MSRQFCGIEDLGMTAAQGQILLTALQNLCDHQSKYRKLHNHWRERPDNKAVIFEGIFNDEDWTKDSVTNKFTNIFNVDPASNEASSKLPQYGPVATFSRSGDKLHMYAIGGLLSTWEQSRDQVIAYLAATNEDWEEEKP